MRSIATNILVLSFSIGGVSVAQPSEVDQASSAPAGGRDRLQVEALRVERGPAEVDGRLDALVWQGARWIEECHQKEPDYGQPPKKRAEIAFLYDDGALYVGVRAHSQSREISNDLMARRDEMGNGEVLVVSLDTYLDRRTAYTFGVTAAGVRIDYFHPIDHEYERDFTSDPV